MVDKIKENIPVKPKVQAATASVTSPQALKENFKSISSNLSVAQVSKQLTTAAKNSDDGATRLSSSLKDAVKYSKQALKVLEDVVAGDLKPDGVERLLSDGPPPSEIKRPPRERDGISVTELAGDLETLKDNLTNLFEALKLKANQTEVSSENKKASEVDISDLEEAQSKAESTSMRIQFNGREALYAHGGLTLDSVAQLLNAGDVAKV